MDGWRAGNDDAVPRLLLWVNRHHFPHDAIRWGRLRRRSGASEYIVEPLRVVIAVTNARRLLTGALMWREVTMDHADVVTIMHPRDVQVLRRLE